MRLLVLGGTAMLGRAVTREALAQGIDVTCAARGSQPVPDGAHFVIIDRDSNDGLEVLRGQRWDVVIDVARQPGHARRAVRDLTATHWVFISSGNAYAHFDQPDQPEDAELLAPLTGDVMADMSQYGPAKVACEQAIQTTGSWTIIRAGLVGGAGDWSGRSGYYPWRFAHPTGPDVLVPPDLTFPIAMIDNEDLAAWILHCATHRVRGIYNATGPTITLQEFLDTARAVARATATARPVPAEVLTQADISAWMGTPALPLWIDDPDWRWFSAMDTTAARREGLTTRPLAETLAAALEFDKHRTEPRATGLTDHEERILRQRLNRLRH